MIKQFFFFKQNNEDALKKSNILQKKNLIFVEKSKYVNNLTIRTFILRFMTITV